MLRQICRYFKHNNAGLWIKNELTSSVNILNVSNSRFYQFNLKSDFPTSSASASAKYFFVDNENNYAYNVLQKVFITNPSIITTKSVVTSLEDFNNSLDQNWRESTISEIVDTFLKVKHFCVLNKIAVTDTRFDKLVDGLVDHCEHISDEELINILYCLGEFPFVDSYTAHNFHDIWSCLDDICCWKIVNWDTEKCFVVANAWYQLHLGKLCDYIFILIDRFVKRADSLTKEQLINIYFYLNICRRRAVDFEYEFALEKLINEMDVDEMAVVAMGYFKTKTKIKVLPIQVAMANRVIETAKTVQDISLTAILKTLRFSKPIKIYQKIEEMTDKLYPEIDRLSYVCCTHLALMSTGIVTFNKNIFNKISEKFIQSISNVDLIRVKDIERMLNALTMFNYDPKTDPDIFKASLDELRKRQDELKKHPRCLICALNYLSLRNIYPYDLLNKVLDIEYIDSNFGKGPRSVPRELFSLNSSIDIECPGYSGNRLPSIRKYKSVKWLLDYTPTHDQYKKLTAADRLVLDTIDTIKSIVGNEKLMHIDHILPHFSRADIVLCKDKQTGEFVEPKGFENYVLGDVMVPPLNDSSLEWFAIVMLSWNNTIKDCGLLLGHSVVKERQLKRIGYQPVLVIWHEFLKLSEPLRKEYILKKLN